MQHDINDISLATTYYTAIPNSGPGTTANIDPEHRGITSLIQTTSFSMPAPPPAAVTEASAFSPVDDAMERAKVPNADPPRFSQVDPTGLKSLLREKTASSLTFETVLPSQHESVVHWTFGSAPEEVEITVIVFEAHNAAIQGMRTALHSISAPLNEVFTSTLGLGQLTLEGVGGYGFILFVRDNVFVSMKGLPSSEKLGEIAAPVDAFLKKKEDDPKRIPAPPTEPGDLPTRQVQAGTEFEVAVKVANAGWMTASTDLTVVQLLEVDKASATFKFFAVAAGTADIYLVFAHEDTLQTTTKKVKIEVIGDSNEEAQVVIREVEI
ncbi:hypothetical protein K439DRAFT_1109838 [Ramaria rubella]|nr:hypothetical protein K439DRAFT_1109838 [Ramaria rubella]